MCEWTYSNNAVILRFRLLLADSQTLQAILHLLHRTFVLLFILTRLFGLFNLKALGGNFRDSVDFLLHRNGHIGGCWGGNRSGDGRRGRRMYRGRFGFFLGRGRGRRGRGRRSRDMGGSWGRGRRSRSRHGLLGSAHSTSLEVYNVGPNVLTCKPVGRGLGRFGRVGRGEDTIFHMSIYFLHPFLKKKWEKRLTRIGKTRTFGVR